MRNLHALRGDPGEGIGLSIVKRLCEILDASLEIESIRDKGTTFRILFPKHFNMKRYVSRSECGQPRDSIHF